MIFLLKNVHDNDITIVMTKMKIRAILPPSTYPLPPHPHLSAPPLPCI